MSSTYPGKGSCLSGDVLGGPGQPLLEGDVSGGRNYIEQLSPENKRLVLEVWLINFFNL
jgi:hypothetical protein